MKEAPTHVILHTYYPPTKRWEEFDALVIGSRTDQGTKSPMLSLVHFDHIDENAHHALSGVNWTDTIDRTLDVPHQFDVKNQSFYWVEDDEVCVHPEKPKPVRRSLPSAADLDRMADEQRIAFQTGPRTHTPLPTQEHLASIGRRLAR